MSPKPSAKAPITEARLQRLGLFSSICFIALLLCYGLGFWLMSNNYDTWNTSSPIYLIGFAIFAVGLIMTVLAFFNIVALKSLIGSNLRTLSGQSKMALGLMVAEIAAAVGFFLLILLPVLLSLPEIFRDLGYMVNRP